MKNRLLAVPALALAAGFSLAACGPSNGTHAGAGKSDLHAVASNPAVQADVQRGKAIAAGCVTSTHSVSGLETCLSNAVPQGKRAQVKKCLVDDALTDHLSTHAGRITFDQSSAPLCVGAALPAASTTPSPSAS